MAVHKTTHRIIYGDTDGMGIVYYGNYFRYFERARSEWFRDLYKPPTQMVEEENYLPVLKAHCNYHHPARYDDLIVIEQWVPREMIRPATLRFEYEIFRESDGKLLASGYTTHAFSDPTGKLKRMPKEFREALKVLAEDRRIAEDEER